MLSIIVSKIMKIQKVKGYSCREMTIILLLFLLSFIIITYKLYSNVETSPSNSKSANFYKIDKSTKDFNRNSNAHEPHCTFFTCFDVYRCGSKGNHLLVYVYPEEKHTDSGNSLQSSQYSKESELVVQAIRNSKYYTTDPKEACIFVPSMDMFNSSRSDPYLFYIFTKLQLTRKGRNHLIFDFSNGNADSHNKLISNLASEAMIAGLGKKSSYRRKFDISLPVLSSHLEKFSHHRHASSKKWLVTSSQLEVYRDSKLDLQELKNLYPNDLEILNPCSERNKTNGEFRCANHRSYKYPEVLQMSTFCMIMPGEKSGLSVLLDALATKCIPVVVYDTLIMPFDEVIDWSRAAVFVQESDVTFTVDILKKYSAQKIKDFRRQGVWVYDKYLKSIDTMVETTLDLLSSRIFSYSAKNYAFWNEPIYEKIESPLISPTTITKNNGFTAVILTYDRIELLFQLILKLSQVPSLAKILIVWNNEYKRPPSNDKWPKVPKEIKVIPTEKNLLSNRFFPYDDIETEAILSIDDDILMLTEDEIQFAYEVWREFPDRIVGFPSRTHTWDNKTQAWKYESEWTNQISMVLTGATFYHKYWSYVYTAKLPSEMKEWIDTHMNCEDIAMNFLISNVTRKAPIKVTAKKKFRCPECTNTEMLSADLTHMVERTQCINQFSSIFGNMPLMSVEFRADPVLFKDKFPDKLKRFNNIGNL